MDSRALWSHFERHHGIVTRAEAKQFGLTDGQIANRVKTGQWVRIAPSSYRLSGVELTWFGRARAEALSAGGLISHRAALVVHRIDGYRPGRIELVVPRGRAIRRTSCIVHETTQPHLWDAVEVRGIPCTAPARTVLDTAAVVPAGRLEWTVDAALRQGLVEWLDLYDVLVRHSRRGRDGCGRLRALLDVRFGSTEIPDSKWNRLVAHLLVDSDLPAPRLEFEVEHNGELLGRVDLAYPRHRLAIELDSARFHLNRDSFEKDPRRKNKMMVAGWTVLTFTWSDYVDSPGEPCATVRSALRAA